MATSAGFVPNRVERVKLREGAVADLTLVLRRQLKRPEVGDPAPPFFVKTLSGEAIGLHDLRGKFVLLHFWHPQVDNCAADFPHLKAVRTRFGRPERLVILGFCLANDPKQILRLIKDKGLVWPQVFARDGWSDATVLEYEVGIPATILIGPDGRVIVRDLQGPQIEEAVAKALGGDVRK